MSTIRLNPNNSERENWINNDEGLYIMYTNSRLSLRNFIKKYKHDIDMYIKSQLNKKSNPLALPSVHSMSHSPLSSIELRGMGRGNPKLKHKQVSPKNEYVEQAEVYKGYVIFHNLTKDHYYILNDKSEVIVYDKSFRHIKNYIDGMGRRNPVHKEYHPIKTYKGYTIEDIHDAKYLVYAKNGEFIGEVETFFAAKSLIDKCYAFYGPSKSRNMNKNPLTHYPKTKRGRPRKVGRPKSTRQSNLFPRGKGRTPIIKYFMLDLYNSSGKLTNTLIGQGTAQTAKFEAQQFSTKKGISRVELSGPYSKRPTKDSTRM